MAHFTAFCTTIRQTSFLRPCVSASLREIFLFLPRRGSETQMRIFTMKRMKFMKTE